MNRSLKLLLPIFTLTFTLGLLQTITAAQLPLAGGPPSATPGTKPTPPAAGPATPVPQPPAAGIQQPPTTPPPPPIPMATGGAATAPATPPTASIPTAQPEKKEPAPAPPASPAAPAAPKAPALPNMPSAPKSPAAPTAPTMPTAPTIPSAPKAPAAPDAPVVQATAPTTTIPTAAPAALRAAKRKERAQVTYKKELEQITESMNEINTHKDELKKLLRELDEKLHDARNKAAEAKKASFGLLQKETEKEAQDELTKVKGLLKTIEDLQKNVQGDFSKKFNDKKSAIKVQISVIEGLLKNLEAKGAHLQEQVTQAQAKQEAKKPQAMVPAVKTMTSKVINTMSDATAWSIKKLRQAKDWLMKPPANGKKKKVNVATPAPAVSKAPAAPPVPPIAGVTPAPTPTPGVTATSTLATEMKNQLSQLNNALQILDQEHIKFIESYGAAKQGIKGIKQKIAKFTFVTKHLKQEEGKSIFAQFSWKQIIVHIFSKAIDLTVIIVKTTKNILVGTYQKFISPLVKKFTMQVKEKLKKDESSAPAA